MLGREFIPKSFTWTVEAAVLKDFYLEVHYEGSDAQDEVIQRVLKERRKTVYAMVTDRAAIVIDGPKVRLLGNVNVFTPQLETIE